MKTKQQLQAELAVLKEDRANLEREIREAWACARKFEEAYRKAIGGPSAPRTGLRGPAAQGERPMKLRTIYTKSTGKFDSVLIDSYPIGGGVWQGPKEIAEEIAFRINAFEASPRAPERSEGSDPISRNFPKMQEQKATGPIPNIPSPRLCPKGEGAYLPSLEGSFNCNPCLYCDELFSAHKPRPVEGGKGPGGAG